jgi:hypothetical protein
VTALVIVIAFQAAAIGALVRHIRQLDDLIAATAALVRSLRDAADERCEADGGDS